jgi:hypothetical protein
MTTGVPRSPTRVSRKPSGVPRNATGVHGNATGVPRKATGVPRKATGVPRKATGVPRKATGVPRKATGVPRKRKSEPRTGHVAVVSSFVEHLSRVVDSMFLQSEHFPRVACQLEFCFHSRARQRGKVRGFGVGPGVLDDPLSMNSNLTPCDPSSLDHGGYISEEEEEEEPQSIQSQYNSDDNDQLVSVYGFSISLADLIQQLCLQLRAVGSLGGDAEVMIHLMFCSLGFLFLFLVHMHVFHACFRFARANSGRRLRKSSDCQNLLRARFAGDLTSFKPILTANRILMKIRMSKKASSKETAARNEQATSEQQATMNLWSRRLQREKSAKKLDGNGSNPESHHCRSLLLKLIRTKN